MVRNCVGVPLHAGCRRAVRSFRAGPCGAAVQAWIAEPLLRGCAIDTGMDWLGGWRAGRGRRAARHGPQRGAVERRSSRSHRSRYSPAGHIVVTSHGTGSWSSSKSTRRGPTSRSPTSCVDCGETASAIVGKLEPTAADHSPHVPRRHAARHNHRGWRHRRGYDQIQPPTAASNDQIQAGDLSAAPQSRAWTADNTGLPRQQRSCRVPVVSVGAGWRATVGAIPLLQRGPRSAGANALNRHRPAGRSWAAAAQCPYGATHAA